MKNTDLKKKRDADLYDAYLSASEDGQLRSLSNAADVVRNHPAPRYYISGIEAAKHFSRIESGISLIRLNSLSRKRIWHLYDLYVAYRAEHPECGLSRERVAELLVEEPAPEFYLTAEAARKILAREIRRRKARWM